MSNPASWLSSFAQYQGAIGKPPGIMEELLEIRKKALVSTGVCLEKIHQKRGRYFDFSCPVVAVYLPALSVNHVMAHHFDFDIFKTQIKEMGEEFTAGIRIEIVNFFHMTRKFRKDIAIGAGSS
jgi:hypothetical protein